MTGDAGRLPRPALLAAVLGAAAVLALRLFALASFEASPLSGWPAWRETDEHAFLDWSERLASGGWADAPAYRPYFSWQGAGGSAAAWERRLPANAFYSGPLYAYALALVRRAAGDPVTPGRLLQALLAAAASLAIGAAAAGVVVRIRGAPPAAASAAGFAAAVLHGAYGPLVFHDLFLYRDGPVAHVTALLIALPLLLGDSPRRGAAFGVGLLAGLAVLLKQTLLPLGLAALWAAAGEGATRSGRRPRLLAGAAGLCLALAPFVARNVSVGVSPLTFDTRQSIGLAWGSAPGADATVRPPASMLPILDRAAGSTWRTALLVWQAYDGRRGDLLRLLARKAASFFHRYEVPDNASFGFFRERLAVLAPLPVFACLLGPGLVGLLAAVRGRLLRGRQTALLAVALATPLLSSLLVQTTSRYRASLAAPLALGAGLGLALAVEAWAHRARRATVGGGFLLALSVSCVPLLPAVIPTPRARGVDAVLAATLTEARGDADGAAREILRYVAEGTDDPEREGGLLLASRFWHGERGDLNVDPWAVAPPDRRFRPPAAPGPSGR